MGRTKRNTRFKVQEHNKIVKQVKNTGDRIQRTIHLKQAKVRRLEHKVSLS